MGQFLSVVELQSRDDAEAVAQRVGEHAGARRRADQGEGRQVQLHGARRRALADHDVQLEVFQSRIEYFLDDRAQTMDFVDEQHVMRFEIGQQRRQVAGALQHRAGGDTQIDAHLTRDDVRQGGLAQAGRTEQQDMIEGLAPVPGGGDEDVELLAGARLADIFGKPLRPQGALEDLFIARGGAGGDQAVRGGKAVGFEHGGRV
jgi:hypothetical protein